MMNGELQRNLLLARMDEILQRSPLETLMVGELHLLLPAMVAGMPLQPQKLLRLVRGMMISFLATQKKNEELLAGMQR